MAVDEAPAKGAGPLEHVGEKVQEIAKRVGGDGEANVLT